MLLADQYLPRVCPSAGLFESFLSWRVKGNASRLSGAGYLSLSEIAVILIVCEASKVKGLMMAGFKLIADRSLAVASMRRLATERHTLSTAKS